MMSADLDWTSVLGEAVVADQPAVLVKRRHRRGHRHDLLATAVAVVIVIPVRGKSCSLWVCRPQRFQ